MPRFNGPLKVLAYLLTVKEPVTLLKISQDTKLNYRTVKNAVETLKELGFVNETIESGPPVRRLIRLTKKGREAAVYARKLLELAGLL